MKHKTRERESKWLKEYYGYGRTRRETIKYFDINQSMWDRANGRFLSWCLANLALSVEYIHAVREAEDNGLAVFCIIVDYYKRDDVDAAIHASTKLRWDSYV